MTKTGAQFHISIMLQKNSGGSSIDVKTWKSANISNVTKSTSMWPFSEISTKTRWTACFSSCPMCVRILRHHETHSSYQAHRLKSTTQEVICPNFLQSHQNRAILTFWCGSFKTIKRWLLTVWEMGPHVGIVLAITLAMQRVMFTRSAELGKNLPKVTLGKNWPGFNWSGKNGAWAGNVFVITW